MKPLILFLITGSGLVALSRFGDPMATQEDALSPGRQVYIAEGCINCHSQYARPDTLDQETTGPASAAAITGSDPVLIGNRRQGPDLSNVGARRSKAWNRRHLIDPGNTSPDSRMPSYAYLFDGIGSNRGEALLEYLARLTARQPETWWETVYGWKPENTAAGDVETGSRLFQKNCAHCHGPDGRGPGSGYPRFSIPPTNLVSGPYRLAPASMDPEMRALRIARIIKFGQPGTSMPGHEFLTGQNVVDLLSFLNITTH